MRARYFLAVAAVLIIGASAKLYLYPPQKAEAKTISAGPDIHQMHLAYPMGRLGAEKLNDRPFVFSDEY